MGQTGQADELLEVLGDELGPFAYICLALK
jgi:hypothetical protein